MGFLKLSQCGQGLSGGIAHTGWFQCSAEKWGAHVTRCIVQFLNMFLCTVYVYTYIYGYTLYIGIRDTYDLHLHSVNKVLHKIQRGVPSSRPRCPLCNTALPFSFGAPGPWPWANRGYIYHRKRKRGKNARHPNISNRTPYSYVRYPKKYTTKTVTL